MTAFTGNAGPVSANGGIRRGAVVSALLALVFVLQAPVLRAQDALAIEYDQDLVSLSATQADLHRVLRELAQRGGFRLWLAPSLEPRRVDVQIEAQKIEAALERLLADDSFALVYADDGALSAVYVLPPGDTQSTVTTLRADDTSLPQQVVRDALQSELLPDDIKAAILDQTAERPPTDELIEAHRARAVETLIERLQQLGSASPETLRGLQDTLDGWQAPLAE